MACKSKKTTTKKTAEKPKRKCGPRKKCGSKK